VDTQFGAREMNLREAIKDLAELPREATIYVAEGTTLTGAVPVLLVGRGAKAPPGWRYFLEVLIAREVLEVWSSWHNDRMPSPEEADEAIIYYAENDAYIYDDLA